MRVLVDTNILLRSAQPNHPLCSQATHAVAKLIRQKQAVFFCPQNIAEFWNVATRPAELNGLGLSHEEVLPEVSSIESLLDSAVGADGSRQSIALQTTLAYAKTYAARR